MFVYAHWGDCSLDLILNDVMGLTKINFNTCLFKAAAPSRSASRTPSATCGSRHQAKDSPRLPFKFYI